MNSNSLPLYLRPKILAIFFLGFASGLPLSLTGSTLSAWLSDVDVDKTTIGLFAILTVPYSLKFLWSPLIDHVKLPILTNLLGRRRSWMLVTQMLLMGSIAMLGFSQPASLPMFAAIVAFLVVIASASQDIVIDAYRVELLKKDEQGAGAVMVVYGYRVGMQIVAGALALILASKFGWQIAYLIMASFILVGVVTMLLTGEPEVDEAAPTRSRLKELSEKEQSIKHGIELILFWSLSVIVVSVLLTTGLYYFPDIPLWSGAIGIIETIFKVTLGLVIFTVLFGFVGLVLMPLSGKSIEETVIAPFADFMEYRGWWVILLFIILFKFGDAFAGLMRNPFLLELGFDLTDIAAISKLYGFTATMVGAFLGGLMVHRLGMLKSLWIAGILQLLSNLVFIWQAQVGDHTGWLIVTITLEDFSGGMGTTAFVAYISSLCHVSYTATQYALLSSLASVGRTVLAASSGWFAETVGWTQFFIISSFVAVPGLIMLLFLMNLNKQQEQTVPATSTS